MTKDNPGQDPAAGWDRRWATGVRVRDPAAFVVDSAPLVPDNGRAVDIAGGAGRHSLWLAGRGLDVTLVDFSKVALAMATGEAKSRGLEMEAILSDVETNGFPNGTWDLVLIHHFLDRNLLDTTPDVLNPGGLVMFCQPTVRNLERNERPAMNFLLGEGEIVDIAAAMGLEVLLLEEDWGVEGRHEGQLIARRDY